MLTVNFGPNHPSTHGVLRLIVDLYGEDVVGLAAVDRLPAHRLREEHGAEDVVEGDHRTRARIDYVSFQTNELVFVLAIEKLLELEMPAEGRLDADAASAS